MSDFNTMVIEEFRSNGGVVTEAADFGDNLVLLHSTGARTGTERVHPLFSTVIDGDRVVIASKAGAPDDPAWFRNLAANPDASIEIGQDGRVRTHDVVARVTDGDERDRLFEEVKRRAPGFAEYEAKTDRTIPVVVLDPA